MTLDTVTITRPDGTSAQLGSINGPVLLDSGSTAAILPQAIVNTIVKELKATYSSTQESYVLNDCSVASQAGTLDYKFGPKTIKVPYSSMIRVYSNVCILDIESLESCTYYAEYQWPPTLPFRHYGLLTLCSHL